MQADDLIFRFGWKAQDVSAMTFDDIMMWHARAADYAKRRGGK